MRLAPAAAVLVTGLALYCSRGILDYVQTPDGPTRVALLPPWQTLGGFLAIGALGWLWLDWRAVPRRTATAVRPATGPLLLPLLGLGALLVPYLPWVDRAVPAVDVLGGPLRPIVWLVVMSQLAWTLWQSRLLRADALQRLTVTHLSVVIAIATAAASGLAASQLAGRGLYPGGDEPHYLVVAQSIWRDGDLRIENNHQRRDYAEYFPADLEPHYLTRGADGEIYSIHPVGLPLLMAPVYAAGGYGGVVFAIVLMAALAAGLMWRSVVHATNAPGAATFAWAGIALTSAFLFNSFAVYPEIAAGLSAVVALVLASDGYGVRGRWIGVGLACGALPWLSTKYAPMSAALVAVALARVVWPVVATTPTATLWSRLASRATLVPAGLVMAPYVVSLAAWFTFFAVIWGSPWPQAPYGRLVQTDLINLTFGAPGLLFDQEYGLLPYAPVFVLAGTGLWVMWKDGGALRRRAVETALVFAALIGTVGAFRIWWGGTAAPGRPITSGLLLLMLPMAMAFRATAAGTARRAVQHALLALSIGVAAVLLFAQRGFLLANGRDGTSTLLEYASARWPAWTAAPSFIHHDPATALASTAIWVAAMALGGWAIGRRRLQSPGAASLTAQVLVLAVLATGSRLAPLVPVSPPWPALDLTDRTHLALLDHFDAAALPVGLAYRPFAWSSSPAVLAQARLEVIAGRRAAPQLVRVLHNGRFSLPAGRYRLDLEFTGSRRGETVGLQIGRTGDAWLTWAVDAEAGATWSQEFTLPVDAVFVGLRGSAELERAIGRILFTPIRVVDAARRPRTPEVIGASTLGSTAAFYHDANVFPEAGGFWVRGERATRVSIVRPGDGPLVLRVHSGNFQNRLRLSAFGWTDLRTLVPEEPQDIEVPAGVRRVVTIDLATELAHVPRDHDPASRDPRPLGAWIEVVAP